MIEYLLSIIAGALAAIVVITFHEFAHAFVAYKCGDPTAKFSGRMTLNPVKHFDPLGMLMFALVGFGWAKPVPVNPYNFRHYKSGAFWTSAAGIIMNYLMAFILYPVFVLAVMYLCPVFEGKYAEIFIYYVFYMLFAYSLNFCVFNLLPFYPLDGFRIYDALTTKRGKFYWFLRQYGYYIFLGLMLVSILSRNIPMLGQFDVLGHVMSFATDVLGKPITLFWDMILNLILR